MVESHNESLSENKTPKCEGKNIVQRKTVKQKFLNNLAVNKSQTPNRCNKSKCKQLSAGGCLELQSSVSIFVWGYWDGKRKKSVSEKSVGTGSRGEMILIELDL